MLKCKFRNFIKNLTSDGGGLVQHSCQTKFDGHSQWFMLIFP